MSSAALMIRTKRGVSRCRRRWIAKRALASRLVRHTTIGCVRFSWLGQGIGQPGQHVGQHSAKTKSQEADLLQPSLYRPAIWLRPSVAFCARY